MADSRRRRFPLLELGAVVLVACALMALCAWPKLIPVKCETWVDTRFVRVENCYSTLGICWAVKRSPELDLISLRCFQGNSPDKPEGNWVLTSVETEWLGSSTIEETRDYIYESVASGLRSLCYFGDEHLEFPNSPVLAIQISEEAKEALADQVAELISAGIDWTSLSDYIVASWERFEWVASKVPHSDGPAEQAWLLEVTPEMVIPAEVWVSDPVLDHYFGPDEVY